MLGGLEVQRPSTTPFRFPVLSLWPLPLAVVWTADPLVWGGGGGGSGVRTVYGRLPLLDPR